jgi:response regulator RpfG family c-di-GMP phosphodiesterase
MKQPAGIGNSPSGSVNALSGIETTASEIGTILSISTNQQDHVCLRQIIGRYQWDLRETASLLCALGVLQQAHVSVVICERESVPNSLTEVVQEIAATRQPPSLIVTSRVADDKFWSEALNLGAYDVLAKPLEPVEVIRIVSLAALSWRSRYQREPKAGRGGKYAA